MHVSTWTFDEICEGSLPSFLLLGVHDGCCSWNEPLHTKKQQQNEKLHMSCWNTWQNQATVFNQWWRHAQQHQSQRCWRDRSSHSDENARRWHVMCKCWKAIVAATANQWKGWGHIRSEDWGVYMVIWYVIAKYCLEKLTQKKWLKITVRSITSVGFYLPVGYNSGVSSFCGLLCLHWRHGDCNDFVMVLIRNCDCNWLVDVMLDVSFQ